MTDWQRKRPIIAVFGGTSHNQAHEFARFTGEELLHRGAIVLSGGTGALLPLIKGGSSSEGPVKETAIVGAESADVRLRYRWIGVDPSGGPDGDPYECGFRIQTNLGDARNFVEAHLCDAAIVLPGEIGTRSEATFALVLGKPVIFVGNDWTSTYQIENTEAIPEIVNEARKRVGAGHEHDDNAWLWSELAAEVLETRLKTLPELDHLSLPRKTNHQQEIATIAVRWILELLGSGRQGSFPPLDAYGEVRSKYEQWLREADAEVA
jgi:uncharacterized protein (TIGR00725 family)